MRGNNSDKSIEKEIVGNERDRMVSLDNMEMECLEHHCDPPPYPNDKMEGDMVQKNRWDEETHGILYVCGLLPCSWFFLVVGFSASFSFFPMFFP